MLRKFFVKHLLEIFSIRLQSLSALFFIMSHTSNEGQKSSVLKNYRKNHKKRLHFLKKTSFSCCILMTECQNSSFPSGIYRRLLGRKKLQKGGEKGFSHVFLQCLPVCIQSDCCVLLIEFIHLFQQILVQQRQQLLFFTFLKLHVACAVVVFMVADKGILEVFMLGLLLLAGLPVDKTLGRIVGITILGKNSLSHLCNMDFMFEWQK